MGRRFLRWIIYGAAAIVLLVIAAAVVVHTPPARRAVERKVTELLAQQDITFSSEAFRYNVFGLGAELRNVRLLSPRLKDAPPFLEIANAEFNLSTAQLLRGRYVLETGNIEGVRLHYFVNEDGIDNLPRQPADPDSPSQPIDYLIADLRVSNAHVRYEDRKRDIDVTLPNASLTMAGSALTDRHDIRIEAKDGSARIQKRSARIDFVEAAIDLGRDDVKIERAQIAAEGAQLNASGTFGPFDQPMVEIAVQATADAARAARVAQLGDPVSGQISLEASLKGQIDALHINAHVVGSAVQYRELTGLSIDTVATYQAGANRLQLSRFDVRSPHGAVTAQGDVAVRGTGDSQLTASVEALNAEPVMRALRLPYRIGSRVDGRLSARWPGLEYTKAAGDARVFFTPVRATATPLTLPVGGRVDIISSGARLAATLRNVRIAAADVNGRITIADRNRLEGALRARADNAQTTINALQAFLGRGRLVPVDVSGSVIADARIGGVVSSPTLTADVQAPALTIGDATDVSLDSRLTYRRGSLDLHRAAVTWQGARAQAAGTIGLQGAQPIKLTANANSLQVEQLLRALKRGDIPASGVVSANAEVRGTAARPLAAIRLQGADLVAYQELWGNLTAEARVAGRQIDVTSLRVDKPQPQGDGAIIATGSYHLDARRYSVDVGSKNIGLLSMVLPDGRPVRGGVELTARSSGTVADPSGQAHLTATALIVGDYALGDINADTTLANRVAATTLRADRFALTAKSEIGVERPYPATIAAEVSDLDLAALPLKLQTPLTGRVSATATAQGPLAEPIRGRAHALVESFAGSWRQMPFAIDGPANLRYEDERLIVDRLRVVARDSTIDISGNLPVVDRSAPGTVNVKAEANLATLVQYAPVGTDVAADGRLTLSGTLQGTLKAIDPNLKLVLEDALILSPEIEPGLSNLNATASIANGVATVDQLTANWGTAEIGLSARVPLDLLPELPVEIPRVGGPATANARLDGLNPGAIPGAPAGLGGRISFDADIAARRPDIRVAEGKITFQDLQLAFNKLTLEQQSASAIAIRDGVATIQSFALAGSVGTLAAIGSVGLTGSRPIDVDVDGNLNIAAISIVTDRVRAEGDSTIDIAADGTVADPVLSGHVAVRDGVFVSEEPQIAAEGLNLRLELDRNRINIAELRADVNGGTLTGTGGFAIARGGLSDVNVELATRDFAYDAPLDLRSLSDADVRLRSQDQDLVVSGQVTIQEAGLTGDINFDTGLLATITARRQLDLTPERNPLLERLLLNVNVDTATPILVDNNLAKAEVTTDLRVVGTPYETGLLGRLEVLEGGLVTLNERTYEVERGQMTFIEERRIFPSFDLVMNTDADNYDVRLSVSGEPGNTETTLTSNPPLPEPDIMAILITGRTLEQMRGEEYEVAREQVLSYLTGRVGSTIGRSVARATGLDTVRIEPQLIANDADPGARLTVAEDVSDLLTLTYSVDLADSDDQIWLATYDVTRRFQTRALRQSDNSYRLDFRHDVRRGGKPEPRRMPRLRPEISAIAVPEDAPVAAAELHRLLGVKIGDDFDYFAVRDGVEAVEARLRELGWTQSRVRLDRSTADSGVQLGLRIARGPQVEFVYAGATPPAKIQDAVGLQWHRGVFDAQRIDDAVETLVEWLMLDDHLQGKVTARVDDVTVDRRLVQFTIQPGPQSSKVLLTFEGAVGIEPDELDRVIQEQELERQLFTDPTVVTELLQRLYREQGYLNAEIDKPRYEFEGAVARVVLTVREGPRFVVDEVGFSGVRAVATSLLTLNLPVVAGDPYLPAAAENALQHLRSLYWERGYNDVRVNYELTIDRIAGRTSLSFVVNEGRQAIVAGIRVAGNDETSDRLVREQLEVTPAEPLNLRALSRSRKNLYDSGAFSTVDLSRDTVVETPDSGALVGAITGSQPAKPVIVDVTVREVQPYQLRYGASYDTEGKLGGVLDVSVHNVFGKARVIGFGSRYDARVREGRLHVSQPTLRHRPIQTTASVYYREERNPATSISDAFNVDRRGASIQQERRLKSDYVWTYGYRFERARTFDPVPDGDPEQLTTVAPISSAFVRETRDDVLDATRGSFSSHAFSFSPKWLGSDDTYLKYFGQYFHYFPLQPERRRRFSNEIIRPRFVFATGIRIGLSKGMGAFVPTSERFYAGGSTTIRGFEQNTLGPIGVNGKPIGGDALFILNNELRFPLLTGIPFVNLVDGVAFLDVGNVFERTADFSFTDIRKAAGVGLRLRTKWVLVRGDYGFLLDRRLGEPRSRFFFSIGQAF
jgi:outer membrane protein assembly complex protein YaeT